MSATLASITEHLLHGVEQLDRLGDAEFRSFELELVTWYRRHEEDQEAIAVAVTRKNLAAKDSRTRHRVDELLAMLDHVHDPFIR